MTDADRKTILIFAGANGAGKTTAAQFLLPHHTIKQFVNADEIARGLSPSRRRRNGSKPAGWCCGEFRS